MNLRIFSFCLLFTVSAAAQDVAPGAANALPPKVSLDANIAPVNATYGDLFNTIEQARALIATANADVDEEYATGSLRLQDDRLTVTLPIGFTYDALAGAPEVAFDAYYEYSNLKSPISDVTIRLSDGSRHLTVSGHSREQVTALHGLLVQELAAHDTFMGAPASESSEQ